MSAPSGTARLETQARRSIEVGSKSFAGAARLLPSDLRDSASLLYAWCRYCDDVIDGQEHGFRRVAGETTTPAARLAVIRRETERVLAGEPVSLAPFRALGEVVRRHAIDPRLPRDLIAGFAMDAEGRRYRSIEETLDYCYHVAGTVGVMMATIMGVRDEAVLDRACDLGIAAQLTNITRDIVEDAGAGRVYVPADWLAAEGVGADPASVRDPAHRAGVARVAARMLAQADAYYASALVGVDALPLRSALAIASARAIYRAIGRKVLRRGSAAWDERVSTSAAEKVGLSLAACAGRALPWPHRRQASREGLWTRPRGDEHALAGARRPAAARSG